jgi:hypothetical protein
MSEQSDDCLGEWGGKNHSMLRLREKNRILSLEQ